MLRVLLLVRPHSVHETLTLTILTSYSKDETPIENLINHLLTCSPLRCQKAVLNGIVLNGVSDVPVPIVVRVTF